MSRLHPWLRTLLSLVLYVSVYYLLFRDIRSIALLVLVIVLHELGHYIAMRSFGYSDIKMLFIPMLGAFVSGSPITIDPGKKLVVLFAGPLPGILIGMISAMIYSRTHQHIFYQLALMFIFLNVFNLIPLTPMDGGQIVQTLFKKAGRWVQTCFILVASAALLYWIMNKGNYLLILLLLLLTSRLLRLWKRGEDIAENETELPVELSWNEKVLFLSIWLAAIIIPLLTLYRIY